MYLATLIISLCWVGWCLIQLALAGYFYRIASQPSSDCNTVKGRAAVLLPVRGSDPSFAACLEALLAQDYPDFEVHVVVDSKSDPAWQVVESARSEIQSHGSLHIHLMSNPLETCGLKCSALIHGVQQIQSEVEYLAMVDSDVVVHRSWLRELLSPLNESNVGVVTGNQWFEPESPAGGASLIRSLWNAGSIVPTVMLRHPWAGSLAMRKSDFDRAGLLKIWSRSIVDDGPIADAFKPFGLEIRFVPSLVMVNREACDAAYITQYVRRMLTWSRHYEPTFQNTVVHAVITGALLLGVAGLTIAALCMFDWVSFAVAASSMVIASFLNLAGYLLVRAPIARIRSRLGQPLQQLSFSRLLRLAFLTNVTQLLYVKSALQALGAKEVNWRGATYSLDGQSNCRLIRYKPFLDEQTDSSII